MNFRTPFAAAAIALLSASSFAQPAKPAPTATPRIDARQAQQEARINQGVKTGTLTRHEAARLDREQGAIRRVEAKAKADGVVTPQERHRLTRLQDKAGQDIQRQKHDAQVARKG